MNIRTDALREYKSKRDFAKTREPSGARRDGADCGIYVVQKHAARRLHYDFRLELDGVLKSWAVTKAPSRDPRIKRLAVRVEDHPLAYARFEGTIPAGQYGAGTVRLWDSGRWTPDGDARAGLRKGALRFHLDGPRLRGTWHLVRMRRRPGEARENWLLIKGREGVALPGGVAA
jgi:bifunctional non-homologous end joining protein LigD